MEEFAAVFEELDDPRTGNAKRCGRQTGTLTG